jgi:hypothetical protein
MAEMKPYPQVLKDAIKRIRAEYGIATVLVFAFGLQFSSIWPRTKPEGYLYSREVQEQFIRLEKQDIYIQLALVLFAIIVLFLVHQRREKKLIQKFLSQANA